MEQSDVIMQGGWIVDGTGEPGRVADVAIHDGRVAAIGERGDFVSASARLIDADGLVVPPGFIDGTRRVAA